MSESKTIGIVSVSVSPAGEKKDAIPIVFPSLRENAVERRPETFYMRLNGDEGYDELCGNGEGKT